MPSKVPTPATETATQLRLLPPAQPLVERFGVGFFRQLPRQPGVYRMFDDADRLIYVGKAVDLRARLNSYRRTHGQSRKTIRLIHTARRIEWEICADETSARLRENELIRTLRPRFNRAGTWPASARFVTLAVTDDGFELVVTGEPAGEAYGAFRAGAACGVAALARLMWLAWHASTEVVALPHELVKHEALHRFVARHPQAADWVADLRAFFGAGDEAVLERLVAAVPEPTDAFGRAYVSAQFERLADFHRRGPWRNRCLRERHLPAAHTLAPEVLDDLLVLGTPAPPVPAFRPDA